MHKNVSVITVVLILTTVLSFGQKKNQPDIQIDVKKELDENGNMKSYDSTYSFSWSGEGVDLDSVLREMNKNFGFSPFLNDDPFGLSENNMPGFRNEKSDSLFGYINPNDTVYHFNSPDEFGFPFTNPFNDSVFEEFFNDPVFNHGLMDPQSIIEEHMRIMEEFKKNFGQSFPGLEEGTDSIPDNFNQQYFNSPKPMQEGWEI